MFLSPSPSSRMKTLPLMCLMLSLAAIWQPLAATPFVDTAAMEASDTGGSGFGSRETAANVDLWGGIGGMCIDPTDPNAVYYYDGASIRRYDFADDADVILYTPAEDPDGGYNGGPFGAFLAFDPASSTTLYFGESTNNTITSITISSDRTVYSGTPAVVYTATAGNSIYAIAFVDTTALPDVAVLSEYNGTDDDNDIVYLDRTDPLAWDGVVIGTVAGYSGALDFAPTGATLEGALFYAYSQGEGPNTPDADETEIVYWDETEIVDAIDDPTTDAFDDADATSALVAEGAFPSMITAMDGADSVLYLGNSVTGNIETYNVEGDELTDDWCPCGVPANGTSFSVVPTLSISSKTVTSFVADVGQTGSAVRFMAAYSYWRPAAVGDTLGAIAQILPNNEADDVASIAVATGGQPTTLTPVSVGRDFTLVLEIKDGLSARITTGEASHGDTGGGVTVVLETGTGVLSGPDDFGLGSTWEDGVITLTGLSINTVNASFTITVTHTASAEEVTTAAMTSVAAGTALAITSTTTAEFADVPFDLTVEVQNATPAVVTTGTDATTVVTIAVTTGTGELGGTTTVNAVAGVATFTDLTYDAVEAIVVLTVTADGLTSDTITIAFSPGAAELAFATAPPEQVDPGESFGFVVNILDSAAAIITAGDHATANVTVAITEGSGTLAGTATVAAVAGVATFTGLSIATGDTYVLTITGPAETTLEMDLFVGYLTQSVVTTTKKAEDDGFLGLGCAAAAEPAGFYGPMGLLGLAALALSLRRKKRAG